jgi:hypothetical protein
MERAETRRAGVARRTAISLLEVTAAAAMLAVLMTISTQMLRAVGGQQRAIERRALAMAAVQAVAEQIGNTNWDDLTDETAKEIEIPGPIKPHLPGAHLVVTLHEEQEPTAAKRVTIELEWYGPHGRPAGPLRLTVWAFPGDLAGQDL